MHFGPRILLDTLLKKHLRAEPLYAKRAAVVTGAEEPPAESKPEGASTEQDDGGAVPAGIPDFWLNVLRANCVTQSKVSKRLTWLAWA